MLKKLKKLYSNKSSNKCIHLYRNYIEQSRIIRNNPEHSGAI